MRKRHQHGPLGSWPRANGAPTSTPITNATAGRKPKPSSFEPRPLLLANVGGEDLAGREHGELLQRSPFALGVAQRAEQDLDLLAGLDGVAPPAAGAHEVAGARHLHHPDRWAILGALLDDAVEREADVRIDPAQLHDLAVDRHGDGM